MGHQDMGEEKGMLGSLKWQGFREFKVESK